MSNASGETQRVEHSDAGGQTPNGASSSGAGASKKAARPFRKMVVTLERHLKTPEDISALSFLMDFENFRSFEKEMKESAHPLFVLIAEAEKMGKVRDNEVDLLIDALQHISVSNDDCYQKALQVVEGYKTDTTGRDKAENNTAANDEEKNEPKEENNTSPNTGDDDVGAGNGTDKEKKNREHGLFSRWITENKDMIDESKLTPGQRVIGFLKSTNYKHQTLDKYYTNIKQFEHFPKEEDEIVKRFLESQKEEYKKEAKEKKKKTQSS